MNTITLQSLQIKSALTTTKPTPSPIMVQKEEKFLTDMVYGINQSQVEPKDRLSNDVQRVDYTTMKFRTISYTKGEKSYE